MDLRKYSRQTNIRLIIGGVILFFLIGDGLIYIFYGIQAAIFGVVCMGLGLAPVVLILIVFQVIDWIVQRNNNL